MSRNIGDQTNSKAVPAELPDDVEIGGGANYEYTDPCKPINPQPGFRYFAAADDGDTSRPDGIARVKAMGYEMCSTETCLSTDCKLMRIPQSKWDAMNSKRIGAATKAALREGNGIQGLPEESTWRSEEHGHTRKVK